jgi:hypothetical protein
MHWQVNGVKFLSAMEEIARAQLPWGKIFLAISE